MGEIIRGEILSVRKTAGLAGVDTPMIAVLGPATAAALAGGQRRGTVTVYKPYTFYVGTPGCSPPFT